MRGDGVRGNAAQRQRRRQSQEATELSYGAFKRQLRLPENIEDEPAAELRDGFLTLTFKLQRPEEKKPEAAVAR